VFSSSSLSDITEGRFPLSEYPFILESYAYIRSNSVLRKWVEVNKPILLDSGAYSAFTRCEVIDIVAYGEFLKQHKGRIDYAAGLDVIGDAEGTRKNQEQLDAMGVKTIPCFHCGEPWEYLEHYAANYDFIALGGLMKAGDTNQLRAWLDQAWTKLVDSDGYAKLKVHGFGLTIMSLVRRYPWFSVDSTSWVKKSRFGQIILDLDGYHYVLTLSKDSPCAKKEDAHLDTLPSIVKERMIGQIEAKGFTIEELQVESAKRDLWNML
jgi:hypothetical protein